jgi:phospholipid/cholesterol/gamma-HCH transport system permease protein
MTYLMSKKVLEFIGYLGGVSWLFTQSIKCFLSEKFPLKLILEQIYMIGNKSMPLIILTAFSTGMVMTLQFGIGLAKFGGQPYVPKMVSLSIFRELGPVFTSLMVAARIGSGIASEIGSMMVTQQIDAMRALGTSPIQKIVVPRLVALMISLPLLACIANLFGVFGSLIISVYELNLDPHFCWLKVTETIKLNDFASGISKTIFFAIGIALTACYYGLSVREGTKEVGAATTKAVVASSIIVLIGDFVLTKFFFVFF